jgi:predicted enzyme related to lactoylglutathione lyase
MITHITHITLFVAKQDDALQFYQKLGFSIHTDADFGTMRWLTLCLPGQKDVELALIKAETDEEKALVGKQAAAKPFISFQTDNCHADYERLEKAGVIFLEKPTEQPWGISAACKDLYGNILYMCQPQ